MKRTLLTIIALLLLVACAPVRAQKPSTPVKPATPAPVVLAPAAPDSVTLDRETTLELSLKLADSTIAAKQVDSLEWQQRHLTLRLKEARETLEASKVAYTDLFRAKLLAAGIPAEDLEKYSGTQDSAGRLVMKRTDKAAK